MTRILLSQATFDRLQPRLAGLADGLAIVTMGKDGGLGLDGKAVSAQEAAPDGAFLSNDIFMEGLLAPFLDALMAAPGLDWMQSAGAGVDHPIFVQLAGKGIRLTTSHCQAVGMADYVLWGVLTHFRSGKLAAAEQAAHRWTRRQSREISGTRWLVIGFGAIGEAVAQRARAFGAHVTGVRRRAGVSPHADAMITPDRIAAHLGESDVVILCAPGTAQTANMVDGDFLRAMKPGAMLVNVGRGSLIDEAALLAALDAGTPGHALLDVFRVEPLPADSRFWDHPRVTVTPHNSGSTTGVEARIDDLFLDNLARYLTGGALINEVSAAEVLAANGRA
jgi:phosphoglycerate dehydrogenase-like enzyme